MARRNADLAHPGPYLGSGGIGDRRRLDVGLHPSKFAPYHAVTAPEACTQRPREAATTTLYSSRMTWATSSVIRYFASPAP